MDSRMRGRLLTTVLLASALSACGSSSDQTTNTKQVPLGNQSAAAPTDASGGSAVKTAATVKHRKQAAPKPLTVKATYVEPAVKLNIRALRGKAPAVVLLPDTGNAATANAEAQKLARLGVGALVVQGPPDAPTQAAAFDAAVGETLAAVRKLRAEPGVDPHRVGIVGEGVGAHVAAVAIGRAPTAVAAAALADIGGVVVPSPTFAPERWLKRAVGIQLLFQRDTAKRAMTTAEVKRLMIASPPGTLMQQYKSLGTAAQAARDTWIKQKLLAL